MKSNLPWGLEHFFDLSHEPGVDPQVARYFRRNFIVNSLDTVWWFFGYSFVSVTTILPVYASTLTDSPLVIGLIPALTDAGWFLPQLFMAPWVERLPRRLRLVGVMGLVERVPTLFLAVAALGLATLPRSLAVTLFLILMIVRALAGGLVALPWQELIASIMPFTRRGRYFGFSHLLGQLVGILSAAISGLILARLAYPQNYALSFFVGFVAFIISWGFLLLTVEPESAHARPPAPPGDRAYLKQWSRILGGNVNFRTYLISRTLSYMGGMAFGFMAVYGIQRFDLPDAQAAAFTAILSASGMVGYGVWGAVGDQMGHKYVLQLAALFWLLALGVALLAPSAIVYYAVFALMGFSSAGGMIGDLNLAMEFGPEHERPTYIGLARTVTGPITLLAPVLGGALAQWASYPLMFGTSLAFAAAGLGMLWLRVVDPRNVPAPVSASEAESAHSQGEKTS